MQKIKLPKKPFIIMRYRIEPFGVVKHVWELMVRPAPEARGNIMLTRSQAMSLIAEQGMVLELEDEDSSLYATPDRAFLRKFRGHFASLAEGGKKKTKNKKLNAQAVKVPLRGHATLTAPRKTHTAPVAAF